MCRLAATLQTAEGKSPDYGGLRRVPELLQELVQELVPELLQDSFRNIPLNQSG